MDTDDHQWHYEYLTPDLVQVERVKEVYYMGKTAYQEVVVQDTIFFGRSLVLDGKTQSSELDEFIYHEALVHPCMIAHPNPQHVFVAGGGEGATVREVLSHKSVTRVVMVDIDREVVELCRRHLPRHARGAFSDPRLELHYDDAYKFLATTQDRFDFIILDVPDPIEAGPAYPLFTQEFYTLVKDRLNSQGLMITQAGPTGPGFYEQWFTAVAKTVPSVFPASYLCEAYVPAFGSTWGFVIGSLGPDPSSLSAEEIDRRIASRVKYPLRYYDGITNRSMFSLPKFLREAIARETRLVTQANPLFAP